MSLVKLSIKGISYSQTQNGAYALILNENEGDRKLPIVIGAFEAQSIAIALESDIRPPRPLTHDLFKNFADRFEITLKQVIIHKLTDGVFYSSVICERDGIEEIIDARTSDAIALAIRFNSPIFTYKNILDKAGVFLQTNSADEDDPLEMDDFDDQEDVDSLESQNIFGGKSLEDLLNMLDNYIQNEEYENAALVRDEITRRENK